MSANGFSPENVIVVGFADDDRAYEAMTTLNELASPAVSSSAAGAPAGTPPSGRKTCPQLGKYDPGQGRPTPPIWL